VEITATAPSVNETFFLKNRGWEKEFVVGCAAREALFFELPASGHNLGKCLGDPSLVGGPSVLHDERRDASRLF
jgi:hypothetical protein